MNAIVGKWVVTTVLIVLWGYLMLRGRRHFTNAAMFNKAADDLLASAGPLVKIYDIAAKAGIRVDPRVAIKADTHPLSRSVVACEARREAARIAVDPVRRSYDASRRTAKIIAEYRDAVREFRLALEAWVACPDAHFRSAGVQYLIDSRRIRCET